MCCAVTPGGAASGTHRCDGSHRLCTMPSGRELGTDLESLLLGRRGEAAVDTSLHSGHQRPVAKPFPAVLGVMDRDDRPAVCRRASCMKHLTLRQAAVTRMNGRDRRPVLLLGTTSELMHDAMRHLDAPLRSMRHPPHARPYTRRTNALSRLQPSAASREKQELAAPPPD